MNITCPNCGFTREVPEDRIPAGAAFATCPNCDERFRLADAAQAAASDGPPPPGEAQAAAPEPAAPAEEAKGRPSGIWQRLDEVGKANPDRPREYGSYSFQDAPPRRETVEVPFEDMERFGFFDGIWETAKRAMFHPGLFFGAMPLGRGRARALIFYILLGELSYLALTLWDAAGLDPMDLLTGAAQPKGDGEFYGTLVGQLAFMVLLPIFYTGYLYISTGLLHVMLKLYRAGNAGFEATLKVNCYASAASLFYLLPVAGMLVGSLWQLVCLIVGLKSIHATGYGRLFAALGTAVLAVALLVAAARLGVPTDPGSTL